MSSVEQTDVRVATAVLIGIFVCGIESCNQLTRLTAAVERLAPPWHVAPLPGQAIDEHD